MMMAYSLSLLAFLSGVLVGLLGSRRFRRDRIAWAQRRLQLVVLSLEVRSLRGKVVATQRGNAPPARRRLVRRLPSLTQWQRWWIARLRQIFPWITRFSHFTPMNYIRWLQSKGRRAHAEKTAQGLGQRGRPPVPDFIVDAILTIKRDNPRYGARRIANIISHGELQFQVGRTSVSEILKAHGFKPGPRGKKLPREEEPGWPETLYNQWIMAMDFKTVLDMTGRTIYILNIIDHGRRVLHWSRATYHPTSEWVAQQLRNAFMDMDTLPEAMVMDRDSILRPIAKRTLPGMNIKPIRIAYKCPWQNAVVERFHRTLNEELLRYVQPVHDRHLNRLLKEFRCYYNTARPHMANDAEPPILPDMSRHPAANDPDFFNTPRKLVRKKWLGGLHSSYRWAA